MPFTGLQDKQPIKVVTALSPNKRITDITSDLAAVTERAGVRTELFRKAFPYSHTSDDQVAIDVPSLHSRL